VFDLALEGCGHVYEVLVNAVREHSVRVIASRSLWEARHAATTSGTHVPTDESGVVYAGAGELEAALEAAQDDVK
jgi:hypothetical protein